MPLKKYLFFLILLFSINFLYSQTTVSGNVYNENQTPLSGVLVVNIDTDKQTVTDASGHFSIIGNAGNELRFVRQNYERVSLIITTYDFLFPLKIEMIYVPTDIEEVKLKPKLSGDLAKDSKALSKVDKIAQLQKDIGLPEEPEKPRETPPPTMKEVGVLAFVASNINVFNLYKNISGDARRMRSLYKYDDFQEKVIWLKSNLNPGFFKENNIKEKKIEDFLSFALLENSEIRMSVKAKNIDKATFALLELVPKYLKRGQ